MRLRNILIPLLVLVAGMASANPFTIQFIANACETNTTAATTYTPDNDMPLYGFVDSVVYDQSGTAATGTLSLVTVTNVLGAPRTIMIDVTTFADATYPVRDLVTTQAGADISATPTKIPLCGDHVRLTLFNYGATNITASVWVVITPEQ